MAVQQPPPQGRYYTQVAQSTGDTRASMPFWGGSCDRKGGPQSHDRLSHSSPWKESPTRGLLPRSRQTLTAAAVATGVARG